MFLYLKYCAYIFEIASSTYVNNMLLFTIYQVKYLLERLQHICNELKDENEIAIMRQYGNEATVFTTRLLRKTVFLLYD